MQADVPRSGDIPKMVKAVRDRWGRVDILVNTAGVGTAVPASRETPEEFRQVVDVNLNGAYWMAPAGGPAGGTAGKATRIEVAHSGGQP